MYPHVKSDYMKETQTQLGGEGMHQTLTTIKKHLEKVIAQVQSAVPNDEPFGNAHNNWSFPGLTRAELIEETQPETDGTGKRRDGVVGDPGVMKVDWRALIAHRSLPASCRAQAETRGLGDAR